LGHAVHMNGEQGKPERTLIVILSVIAVLVVVALVVVFTRGEPKALDPTTPEGVVQLYSKAVIDGDELTAAKYLSKDTLDTCEKVDQGTTDGVRMTLVSTTVRADSADVKVTIAISSDNGPFGASEFETDGVFDMVKQDGDWLIDSAPWPLMVCPNPKAAK
jgi:hypothetical protein